MTRYGNIAEEIDSKQEMHDPISDEKCIPLDGMDLIAEPYLLKSRVTRRMLPGKQAGDTFTRSYSIQNLVPLSVFTNYQTFTEIAVLPSSEVEHNAHSIKIFLAYVDEDEELCNILRKWLNVMERQLERKYGQKFVTTWSNANIVAGQDWKKETERHLATANVILLLASTDFLHSKFCSEIEIKEAMRRHGNGEAHVIPVILRPCSWQEEPFGILKPLPAKGKPVVNWHNRAEAFLDIDRGIRKAIEDLPLSSTS